MSRILQLIVWLSSVLLVPTAFATAQVSDVIHLDGKPESLNTNPLRPFLQENPGLLPQSDFRSTANWRGYVATWEVEGSSLQLVRVDVDFRDPKASPERYAPITRNVIDKLFPGSQRVAATWYSGTLLVPRGKIVDYVHMGYGSAYERYTVLVVKQGLVARRQDFDTKAFEAYRRSQFKEFKKSAEYRKLLKETMSEDPYYTAKRAEDFLFQFLTESYLSADYGFVR